MALRTKRADGIDLTDPVEQVSLAGWFAVAIALLLLSTAWAVYEEVWGLRPWKAYQAQFVEAAKVHYSKKLAEAEAEFARVQEESEEFEAAQERAVEAEASFDARKDRQTELMQERSAAQDELEAVRAQLGKVRGFYQADIYQWEQASTEEAKAHYLEKIKAQEQEVLGLTARMNELSAQVRELGNQIFAIEKDKNEAHARLREFRAEVRKFKGLLTGLESFEVELRQNHIPEWDHRVDRCISCHVGATQPDLEDIRGTLAEIPEFWGDLDKYESLFRSHPGDHLDIHDPAKFGCTSCHAGDGFSLSTLWEAHGTHKLHEYPLLVAPDGVSEPFGHMAEAGCNKCHLDEQEFEGAPLISLGKQLFTEVGCVACHKAKGIMPELDELEDEKKHLASLERERQEAFARRELLPQQELALDDREEELLDAMDAAIEEAESNYGDDQEYLDQMLAKIEAFYGPKKAALAADRAALEQAQTEVRKTLVSTKDAIRLSREHQKELQKNIKLHGPNLLNVRDKLRPSFLKQWLSNPHDFNPETKMPRFWFLDEESEEGRDLLEGQIEAVAAYLWQTADDPAPTYDRPAPRGEKIVEEGQELFVQSGCLACHIGGEHDGEPIDTRKGIAGTDVKKRQFGPTLVRTGEKARFDHLSRWIYDPKALHSQTRMPNMRLSEEQSEAIAAWLVTQREEEVPASEWSQVPAYLNDREKAKEGYEVIQRYGCYSCHQIRNVSEARGEWSQLDAIKSGEVELDKPLMGDEFGRIGVELSAHGSKNLHLFDFGLIEEKVHHEIHGSDEGLLTRYDYIHYKIQNPRSFEEGRYYVNALDEARLRMPSFNLTDEEAHAIGTFVVSLTEEEVPEHVVYDPPYPAGAVPVGRNLSLKHNCIACHTIEGKGGNIRWAVYKDILGDINLGPPNLYSEGRKVQADWLFHFLKVPFELRPHVLARMPYFDLSDDEAEELVRYFYGQDRQPYPFETTPPPHMDAEEFDEAETLFTKLKCAQCHQVGDRIPQEKIAPSFNLAKERLKRGWIAEWVRNPADFVAGMNMPAFGQVLEALAAQQGLSGEAAEAEVDRQLFLLADYLRVLNEDYQPVRGPYTPDIGRSGE